MIEWIVFILCIGAFIYFVIGCIIILCTLVIVAKIKNLNTTTADWEKFVDNLGEIINKHVQARYEYDTGRKRRRQEAEEAAEEEEGINT